MPSPRPVCESLQDAIAGAFLRSASGKELVSAKLITQILNKNLVKTVLHCSCNVCQYQRVPDSERNVEDAADWILTSGKQLFALLAYNACAQLIYKFFETDYNDGGIIHNIQQFRAEYIASSFWSDFESKDPARSNRLAKQISSQKYQFFPPTITPCDSTTIQKFEDDAVIPILRETPLDRGGFGEVYEIQLFDEYNALLTDRPNVPLVRKEVDLKWVLGFSEELDILLRIKELKDEHIVKLVTAYEHGNKINYIFPKATTNLFKFLRDEHSPCQSSTFVIEKNPLWQQTLAVFRVIFRLYDDVYQVNSERKVKVYHFDMKPDNILVHVAGERIQFIVNDFGFSRYQVATSRQISSRIFALGGTQGYAPPEVAKNGQTRNHRYDVWSLGCILLEVCAFVVGGCVGVKELENLRYTMESLTPNEMWDDYFWHSTPAHKLEIKPGIVRWMQGIPEHKNVSSSATSNFLKRMMDLAMDMLNVDVSRRLDVETAQARLCSILQKASTERSNMSSVSSIRSSDDLSGIIPIGEQELDGLKLVNCKYGGRFYDNVRIRFYEDCRGGLHLQLLGAASAVTNIPLGQKSSVLLTPSACNEAVNKIELHLMSMIDPRLRTVMVHLYSSKDTAIMQSVLLGHAARSFASSAQKSLTIKSINIEQYKARSLRNLVGSGAKTPVCSNIWRQPRVVQIWCEKSFHDVDALERIRSRRRPSFQTAIDIPKRNVVIFCARALILIPFAKNVRLALPLDKYAGLQHEFIPTDQTKASRDPKFEIIVLVADCFGMCKVPLEREALTAIQQSFRLECTRLQLDFTSRQDWTEFRRIYRKLKEDWSQQDAALVKELTFGAEQRGWGIAQW